MVEIKEYEKQYAKEISQIVLTNLYSINIKDHGKEVIDRISRYFTVEEIIKNFPKREKTYVAIEDNQVIGTAGLDRFKGDETGTKYIVLTVFIKMENHHQGIGTMLIKEVEKHAKKIGAKQLIIMSSIYGCEFYRKLGYDFFEGKRDLNEDREYTLVKYL